MNVSEFIFDFYNKKGIDTAFAVTGGQAMWLDDAVGKNPNFKIVFHHHEQAATMSADAYGRIRNKPAIALVTAGPGAVNALNGVTGGYTDSSPMIVISGHTNLNYVRYQNEHNIRQYGVQGINIGPLAKPVVKYFVSLDRIEDVKYELEKAYYTATNGRPGPVWIEVPLDVQSASVDGISFREYVAEDACLSLRRNDVQEILDKLRAAKRPVILAGQGISLAGARRDFTSFINKLQIPVITARLGIDLIETNNRLYVGRPGNYGERAANFAIQNADFILSIGCRMASSLVGHSPQMFGRDAYIVMVDIDPEELNKPGVHIDYKLQADCKEFIRECNSCLDSKKVPLFDSWISRCNEWRKRYPTVLPEYINETPVNSYYFCDRLSEKASADSVILVDTGSCFHVACQVWKVKLGQQYLTTGGISSMGYWCAGIGACMAAGGKETIVISGDGSLQMNIQEFATIRGNNLPVKVFVFNNEGYLLIRNTQRNYMEDRFVGEGPESGLWFPDLMKVADSYEIKGVRIERPDEVDAKIDEVLAYNGPVICEIMSPKWQPLIPRVASDKLPDGRLRQREYSDMFPYLDRDEYESNMNNK